MSEELKLYLEKRFYRDNHTKYHKFFKEWVINITPIQIGYFEKEMENVRTNALVKH